jgi:hypothetical protein
VRKLRLTLEREELLKTSLDLNRVLYPSEAEELFDEIKSLRSELIDAEKEAESWRDIAGKLHDRLQK